jgi:hypothetical protein
MDLGNKRTPTQRLEAALFRRGFVEPGVRKLVRSQIVFAAGTSLVLLAVCAPLGLLNFALSYLAGAAVITLNFVSMARTAQTLVRQDKLAVFSLLTLFYGRLILTGLAVYGLIVWLDAQVFGLLAGLSTAVGNAVLWGAANLRHKAKEA